MTSEAPSTERSIVGIDLMRLGFPGGAGFGFRGFPISQLALETGATTFILATSFELSLAALPLAGGPDRKMQPVFRVGYRKMFIHRASDRVVRSSLPRNARSLSDELILHGARLDTLFVSTGLSYRFERPVILEVSIGYLGQVGTTRANGGREALQLSSARFAISELRLTFLLPRASRR